MLNTFIKQSVLKIIYKLNPLKTNYYLNKQSCSRQSFIADFGLVNQISTGAPTIAWWLGNLFRRGIQKSGELIQTGCM